MSSIRAKGLALALCLATGLAGSKAASQSNTALAETLFRDAKRLMDAKNYDQACPKFAESERLDPSSGTMLGLAICHEAQGKLASAWGDYNEVIPIARAQARADREELARKKVAELEPRLSRLTLNVAAGVDPKAMSITLDGRPIGAAALGLAVPVDGGDHLLAASAAGKNPWSTTVSVRPDSDKQSVEIPALQSAVTPPPPPPPPPPPSASATAAPTDTGTTTPKSGLGTQRIAAIAVGGAGVVGLAVGTIFGVVTLSKHGDLQGHCNGNLCDPTGLQITQDAQTSGMIANVALGVGAAAVIGAGVLWFTAPKQRTTGWRVVPMIGARESGLSLHTSW